MFQTLKRDESIEVLNYITMENTTLNFKPEKLNRFCVWGLKIESCDAMLRTYTDKYQILFQISSCFLLTGLLTSLQNNFFIMIQRIQTLLLLAAIGCAISLNLIPCFYLNPASDIQGEIYKVTLFSTSIIDKGAETVLLKNWPLFILNCLVIIMITVAIFGYKKRIQQVKTCNLILLLMVGLLAVLIVEWRQLTGRIIQDHSFSMGTGMAVLVVAFILVIAARHYIIKDEDLVKSADRLR